MSEDTLESEEAPAAVDPAAPPTARWPDIAAAGGIQPWVLAELRRRDLVDEGVDTSRLSAKEKKRFKARREEERRVRRLLKKHAWAEYRRAHLVHVGVGVFHHDTADVDKYDLPDPDARRAENDLPPLKDQHALAEALAIDIPTLRWLCYHREVDTGTHYRRWTIPKRSGGERLISAPKPTLMRCQRWIAQHVTERLPIHGAAHGFVPGRGTLTNAAAHAGAKTVVKLDLKDFYPTLTLPRVKGLFRKAGYGEQTATLLALLCTEAPREEMVIRGERRYVAIGDRSLPQGAPTSPSITNAICLRLDARLTGLAKKLGFTYTRYADDLAFSSDRRKAAVGKLVDAVYRITADEGFRVHPKKTRVMREGRRQQITGLVVNGQGEGPPARVPRKLVRQLRAAIHHRENGRPGKGESLEQLRGWAAYVYMCDPDKGRAFLDRLAKLQ
ncbi:MAG TPA: reverse transcriptase family protein [Polyangiaceae bacterium LLY-WYZ-15_(1-7)]|nr:RNA-dependent DNA polymerase [Myxococcales bacterium]MAT28862.1 RNA-dependent DNA polymerase [Sandaracinus sp.]HJL02962.1 reverse transcriptase family protein [Polyangiaceae bacterium LLY-WYZ-15_(1-7)]HJL13650.1 reverse transcriptase family protein [Polyangiaceae bacterium LLY-WYZ-15_(1-7)]HJL24117.1 reverse transcriptase family protein [Polyangiaceae bacterium LLY-WYZ-15_(1-7)]